MSEVASTPIAPQTNKEKNAVRLQALKDAKERAKKAKAEGAEGKPAKVPREKKEKVVKPCRCGCGGQTTAFFVPGHDARFKGWLLKVEKGEKKVAELPEAVQKGYKWVKRGKGAIPTTNYRGEPHSGYLKEDEIVPE